MPKSLLQFLVFLLVPLLLVNPTLAAVRIVPERILLRSQEFEEQAVVPSSFISRLTARVQSSGIIRLIKGQLQPKGQIEFARSPQHTPHSRNFEPVNGTPIWLIKEA